MKMTAKEIKRRQQTPWQPKQRPHFSQGSDSTQKKPPGFGQARGRGRGRGRAIARNQAWVSGGVLKAGDFLGLRDSLVQDMSQFGMDGDYSQLAETARNFAASAGNTHGYEMYDEYQGYASAPQDLGQSYAQQGQSYAQKGQKRGGANSSSSGFTAYGSYTTSTGASQAQAPSKAVGRGRGYGATRGSGVVGGGRGGGKPSVSAGGASAGFRQGFGASSDMGYGIAVGATPATPLMQSANEQVATEQYATAADSYSAQQQQLYEAYPSYEFGDANAAYSQAAYYTTTGGHYLTPDTGAAQYYSQF